MKRVFHRASRAVKLCAAVDSSRVAHPRTLMWVRGACASSPRGSEVSSLVRWETCKEKTADGDA